METSQLHQSLTFLAYSSGIIILLVGIMLFKLLFDTSKLVRNIDDTTTIVKTELEPTLKNVNKSVEIVSGVIIKTDESVKKVRDYVRKVPGKLFSKLSSVTGKASKGFWDGLCSAFKLFFKR
jgi:predicted PurR-regulated permease PerM